MTARIDFPNDPSVGMWPESYTIELPFEDFAEMETPSDNREMCRKQIEDFYKDWQGESTKCHVTFSDEKQD